MNKRISVVTVCRNAETLIEKTIRSVVCQDYVEYEYIIIDGLSEDGTMSVVYKYLPVFRKKGIVCKVVSEKDKGIYDAMNKAIDMAEGDWIIYLNAGDLFFNRGILSDMSNELNDELGVVYGNVVISDNQKYKYVASGRIVDIVKINPINHQACLTKTEYLKKYRFDISFPLAADYNLFLRMFRDGIGFKLVDKVWVVFLLGGISHRHYMMYQKEMYQSRMKNGVTNGRRLWVSYLFYGPFYMARYVARLLVPKLLFSERRGWYSDKYRAAGLKKIDGK